jgi:chemotaxis protein MotB
MDLPEEEERTMPAWVMTFADLMSLLMCFFVLLLSFAEMDAMKFKQIAGEMSKAFGVQRDVPAIEPPMGTSPIFDRFSPGVPQPTPIDSVRQQTSDERPQLRTFTSDAQVENTVQELSQRQVEASLETLRELLEQELQDGKLTLEQDRERIVIRIEERGAFSSGSSDMTAVLQDMLNRIAAELVRLPGVLTVEGHTDNIPIRTARFQSNWDLSAARASSVANGLLSNPAIDSARLQVHGFAETRPRADNDSPEGRALNRRVEIVVDLSDPLEEFEHRARDLLEQGRDDLAQDLDW